jgi:phosphoglycerate dehydrogenase-like enzyme
VDIQTCYTINYTARSTPINHIACSFVGNLLKGQTVGVIGAGRIGSAYARMMIEGFKMNLIYYDLYQATRLEKFVTGKDIYLPLHICIALHVC